MDLKQGLLAVLVLGVLAGCSNGTAAVSAATTTPKPVDTASLWAGVPISTETTETTLPPAPTTPAADVKYLAAVRPDAGEDDTDADLIKQGHQACAFYRGAESPPDFMDTLTDPDAENKQPPKRASDRDVAQYFLDANGYDDAAVKYLCPKLLDEVAWANAGFTEGDTEVGGKHGIKPGRYHAEGPVSDCYWERVTGGGHTIANAFIKYAPKGVTVTVRSTDGGINTQGCGSWLPVSRPGS